MPSKFGPPPTKEELAGAAKFGPPPSKEELSTTFKFGPRPTAEEFKAEPGSIEEFRQKYPVVQDVLKDVDALPPQLLGPMAGPALSGLGALIQNPLVKRGVMAMGGAALGGAAGGVPGAIVGGIAGAQGKIPGKLGKLLGMAEEAPKELTLPSGSRALPQGQGNVQLEPIPEGGQLGPRGVTPKWSPEERAYVEQQALEEASRPTSVELEQAPTQAPRYKSAPRLSSEEAASMLEPEPTIQLEQAPVGLARGRVGMAPPEQQLSDILQAAGAPKAPATQSPAGVGMRYLSSQGDAMKGLSAEELSAILKNELGSYNQTLRRGKP